MEATGRAQDLEGRADAPRTARRIDRLDAERKQCRDEARAVDTGDFLDMYERHADRACMCTTPACATRVSDEMTREMVDWAKRNPGSSTARPDADATKRMEEIARRLADCLMQAQSTAGTDPTP
ncbi:MAG: hypothetical protein KF773_36845 [Deltaproteobacteria bacterium]|nr:hypothetical protein [Deltaproteobacteria bacterium]